MESLITMKEYSEAVCIPRDGRLYKKLSGSGKLDILFLGGSITEGFDGSEKIEYPYPEIVCSGLRKRFPGRKINCHNLGRIAYMSALGLMEYVDKGERMEPDIVFLEFAVNDEFDIYNAQNYESLVRRILKGKNAPAVIVVNCCKSDGSSSENFMKEIADYYKQPSISIRNSFRDLSEFSDYSFDGLHPHENGHKLISELILYLFDNVSDAQINRIPEQPCYGNPYEDISFFCCEDLKCDAEPYYISDRFPKGIHLDREHPSVSFEVPKLSCHGLMSVVHMLVNDPKTGGRAEVIVNGKKNAVLDSYSIYGLNIPVCFGVLLEKNSDNFVEITLAKGDEKKSIDIAGFGI